MNDPSKSIFASVTFWGIAVSVLAQLAARAGYHVPDDTAGITNDIASLVGAALALWGRFTASQPVRILPPSSGNQSGFAGVRMLLVLAAASLTFACATAPQTPAQSVYAAQGTYASALAVAVAYKKLPDCNRAPRPVLCSDTAVLVRLQAADDAAFVALTAAQNIIRSPNAGLNIQTAIAAANEAVAAMAAITNALGVKP